jgi:hypothetical protein
MTSLSVCSVCFVAELDVEGGDESSDWGLAMGAFDLELGEGILRMTEGVCSVRGVDRARMDP